MFICEISIIFLICPKLGSVTPVQQKIMLPLPNRQIGDLWSNFGPFWLTLPYIQGNKTFLRKQFLSLSQLLTRNIVPNFIENY